MPQTILKDTVHHNEDQLWFTKQALMQPELMQLESEMLVLDQCKLEQWELIRKLDMYMRKLQAMNIFVNQGYQ
jgi:hypothetical protein